MQNRLTQVSTHRKSCPVVNIHISITRKSQLAKNELQFLLNFLQYYVDNTIERNQTLMKYTSKEGSSQQTECRVFSKCIRFKWCPACQSWKKRITGQVIGVPTPGNLDHLVICWRVRSVKIVLQSATWWLILPIAGCRHIPIAPENIPSEPAKRGIGEKLMPCFAAFSQV